MPLYEYRCSNCEARFEMLRPMSQSDKTANCPRCAEPTGKRMISVFAAISRDAGGGSHMIASSGASSCGSCAGGHCSSCAH